MPSTAGVQPSKTILQGSTASAQPRAARIPVATSGDVDKSDSGKKGAKPTKDRGTKNAPVSKE